MSFLLSAAQAKDYPPALLPEVVLIGRSNAGKSSFLNALANQKIARVSASPGKTRLLNFFTAGNHYRIVDMPGYGFAARSGNEIRSWRKMIEKYLIERSCIAGLILIMDIRRSWAQDEEMIYSFSQALGRPLFVVLNKSDKLKKGPQKEKRRIMSNMLGPENVFLVSSLKKKGLVEVESALFESWIRHWKEGV
ncbi:MAG: ribosome biogenesis GTP-binding protein YsxC [Bdellovibrionales bacterium]|nr:ribosome biogenesis GTP-binding protein YsxC [Bdellovibrionales bacterium]